MKAVVSQPSWPRAARMEAPTSTIATTPTKSRVDESSAYLRWIAAGGLNSDYQLPATTYQTSYVVGFFVNRPYTSSSTNG